MKFTQALKMAWSALIGNKARSILTMLGIIIGVFAVTMLISIVGGATDEMTGSLEGMGANMITVTLDSPKQTYLTIDDVDELVGTENIVDAAAAISSNQTIKTALENDSANITGVTSSYASIQEQTLDNGRFLTDLDIETNSKNVVIDYDTAMDYFGTSNCTGYDITIDNMDFTVVGVLEDSDGSITTLNIPITTAQRLFSDKELSNIYLQADSAESIDGIMSYMDTYMTAELGDEEYFDIRDNASILDMLDEITGIMSAVLAGIASISLLVGGIGIMNIMLVSVTERTREIGVRKAIGAKRGDILIQFIIEAVVLCVAGGLIGLILGGLGLQAAGALMDMSFSISASTITLAVGFSIVVGLIFGIHPANKASKLRPIEALRYE